jgi:calcium-dependent protein kinase
LSTKQEEDEFRNTFKMFDKNGNGTISKDELLETYLEIYKGKMTEGDIINEVSNIWDKVDMDGSGKIDYSEWVIATVNKKRILTKEKLKKAFELFDKVFKS